MSGPPRLTADERIERFWSRVDSSLGPKECWPWMGAKHPEGYGQVGWRLNDGSHRALQTHRVAMFLTTGVWSSGRENNYVRHRCNNPPCCNPDHLLFGTAVENAHDAALAGRLRRGSAHGLSKLSDGDVREILKDIAEGQPQAEIARQWKISATLVCSIKRGRCWNHVTGHPKYVAKPLPQRCRQGDG